MSEFCNIEATVLKRVRICSSTCEFHYKRALRSLLIYKSAIAHASRLEGQSFGRNSAHCLALTVTGFVAERSVITKASNCQEAGDL